MGESSSEEIWETDNEVSSKIMTYLYRDGYIHVYGVRNWVELWHALRYHKYPMHNTIEIDNCYHHP